MMRRILFALLVFTAPLAARPVHAADEVVVENEENRLVREVGQQLRCAVCQSESVADSNSTLARNMRDIIREKVRAGESPEDIKAYFVSKYGDYILMEPRKMGVNWLLWGFPFVALLLGGILVALRFMRRPASAPAHAEAAPMETDALLNALRNSSSDDAPQEKS